MIGGGPFGEPLEIGSVKDGGGLPEGWQKVSDYFFQTSYSYSFFSRRRERERERERETILKFFKYRCLFALESTRCCSAYHGG